jgi:hypothetical protein
LHYPQDWPNPSHINILCKKAAGFFIYASTVIKFVASKSRIPAENWTQSSPSHKALLMKEGD